MEAKSIKQPDPNWDYCGVNLTIHNIIIPEERLYPTPSQQDNMAYETEIDLRMVGSELIQDSGVLLRLPQVAMATAQVLYQRFFYSKSFVRHFYEHYAMACIFLAAKLEECPRRIRDIINVFHHIRQVREKKTPTPIILDESYKSLKLQVIKAERRVLKELGFCVHAKHPHKLIICYLQALEHETNQKLVQTAWNYMNDSLRTDIFVRYLPEAIACGCIHLASCKLNIPLPRHPAWWEMFSVSEDSVHEIALCLLRLYARPKPDVTKLEAELALLRKSQAEAKERENEQKKQVTPPSIQSDHSSGYVSPDVVSKSLGSNKNALKRGTDIKMEVDHVSEVAPNPILASAVANAKAVAATISAVKSGVQGTQSEISRLPAISSSTVLEADGLSEEDFMTSSFGKPIPEPNHRLSPDTSYKNAIKRAHESAEAAIRSSVRPAAYRDIPSQAEPDKKHRRHRHKHSSRRHHRHSSSSSSERDNLRNHRTELVNVTSNSRLRQYTHAVNQSNQSSGSETGDSSLSPIKKRELPNSHVHKKNYRIRRRYSPHSSSAGSQSSQSEDEKRSPRHDAEKGSGRYRLSPPAAYRLEHKSKHRLSGKTNTLNGEEARSSKERLNQRVSSRHRDHRRR